MRSLENGVSPSSVYYNFSPSLLAREHLLYVVCAGDFTYAPGYELNRTSFDSYLMEVILEGQVQITTEGEHLTAQVAAIQTLGKEVYLRLHHGEHTLTACLSWDHDYSIGDTLKLKLRKCYLFPSEGGL